MASSSSSTQKQRHLLHHLHHGGPTTAPPPTPSSQPFLSTTNDVITVDTLSRLLHRLPPSLSLPTRRLSPRATTSSTSSSHLPTLSLSSTSSSSELEKGYFQLNNSDDCIISITPELAELAESNSVSLFELTFDEKVNLFTKEWPFGFSYDDDDDDDHLTASFCFDSICSTTATSSTTELRLEALRELTRELEKVGLEVVEKLACTLGFDNPFKVGQQVPKYCSLMWVSSSSSDGDKARRVYPYVVGLQYQIRPGKWALLSDSGPVNVEPQVGSVLVTLGDIAQVWSNGKLKKVRGRPTPIIEDKKSTISMTLLITLPLESNVSPLIYGNLINNESNKHEKDEEECHDINLQIKDVNDADYNEDNNDHRVFNSFSFEDYAWRVYHERLLTKDPLDRYRVID